MFLPCFWTYSTKKIYGAHKFVDQEISLNILEKDWKPWTQFQQVIHGLCFLLMWALTPYNDPVLLSLGYIKEMSVNIKLNMPDEIIEIIVNYVTFGHVRCSEMRSS